MFLRVSYLNFGVMLVIMLIFSACGLAAPEPEADPVSITFAFPESDLTFYQQLVPQFNEQYPNITIELRPLRGNLAVVGLETVDVFLAYPDEIRRFQLEGHLVNLDPFIENDETFDMKDFYAGAARLFMDSGKIWAIPAGMDLMVMFYNQDFLDRYGTPYLETGWT